MYRKNIEKKIDVLGKEIPKIGELHAQFQSLSNTTQEMHENLQHFINLFAIQCPNPNCKIWINIPIPSSLIKDIHLVDGRPTGKFLVGREMQVTCKHCRGVYHIVYP